MIKGFISHGNVAAKSRAMYGALLTRREYDHIMTMKTVGQLAGYLKGRRAWREPLKDINETSIHRSQLEAYLRRGFLYDFNRLMHHIFQGDRRFLEYMRMKSDIEMILVKVRQIVSGSEEILPLSGYRHRQADSGIDMARLENAAEFREIIAAVADTPYHPLLARLPFTDDDDINYTVVENALVSFYFKSLLGAIKKMYPGEMGKKLSDNFGAMVDLLNVSCCMRLRRYFSSHPDALFVNMLPVYYKLSGDFFRTLAEAETNEEAADLLAASPYRRAFRGVPIEDMADHIDRMLYKYDKRLLYYPEPGIHTAVAYLQLKETEIKNIIHIVECVRYGISPDEMPAFLVGYDD